MSFSPQQFIAKWSEATLKERSAAQSHFNDLCRMLGEQTPADADPHGDWYTFEKGADKTSGGSGFADVWLRGHFAWEYKGNHANLNAAYQQLLQYREALENPPLLVVCDLNRFEIHTNFTNTVKKVYAFDLDELAAPDNLAVLRALFTDPERLRPTVTRASVTEAAAEHVGALALSLQARSIEPHRAAHFLVQILFCLFAEDVGLLPKEIFSKLIRLSLRHPDAFVTQVEQLFTAMREGGFAAYEEILHFNGGLFAEIDVVPLSKDELDVLARASVLDWSSIEPAIIGTLFERSLDPARRAQLGAHYTSRADIERVVYPVVIAPLRRRWDDVRVAAEQIAEARRAALESGNIRARRQQEGNLATLLFKFQEELAHVRVLDPACGSGNFLYVALAALKDLEKEVVAYGTANGLSMLLPRVGPGQLYGLEISDYARELTQVVVWIGYLQWMTANGFQANRDPVLEPLETIRLQDSLLDRSDPEHPKEAVWPEADFIIGNPPFLGGKRIRAELGDMYVDNLFTVFDGSVPHEADLVCYFYEKAREQIAAKRTKRAGLLATNSIRAGANREVLKRIKESGDIFMAWDDEPWVLDGAAVRISIVAFDDGSELTRTLDGNPIPVINTDLTAGADITRANRLPENFGIAFMGDTKGGPFDITDDIARQMMSAPLNPNGHPNSDVVVPWVNGMDLTRRPRGMWIIDFGIDMPEEHAALYETPFEYVKQHVRPERAKNRRETYRERWWIHVEARPGLRQAIKGLSRFICTPRVATYRSFVWVSSQTIPDSRIFAFARQDDYFFGMLHSRVHNVWSLRLASWHGVGNDPTYNTSSCFETFPFPWAPGTEPTDDPRVQAIAEAAQALNEVREAWLNPPDASEAVLKTRTLTNLYNARPTWLAQAHTRLDRAVWTAYGWDDPDPSAVDEETILTRLLALNLERAHSTKR
jgi:type II restriction/modification system DNA methylase subunit YeeA